MGDMAGPPAVAAKIQIRAGSSWSGFRCCCCSCGWWRARRVTSSSSSSVAALIAFLLNPLVRGLTRVTGSRAGSAWAIVYVGFVANHRRRAAAIGTVVVNQTKSSASRVDDYFTVAHGQPYQTDAGP
jgi:hypothetical protein